MINATACCLVPLMTAKIGPNGVIICRVAQGIAQGFFYSSVYNLLGCWVPVPERSRLGTIALSGNVSLLNTPTFLREFAFFSGSSFGTIVTTSLVGYMCSTRWGWPATFYLFGALGYCWTMLWFFFGANSPGEHSSITQGEKRFIESTLSLHEIRQVRN